MPLQIIGFPNSVFGPDVGPWELVPASSHSPPPTPTSVSHRPPFSPTVGTHQPTATAIQSLTPNSLFPDLKKQPVVAVKRNLAKLGATQRPISNGRPNFLGEIQTCGRSRVFPTSGGSSGRARAPAQGSWPLQYKATQNSKKTNIIIQNTNTKYSKIIANKHRNIKYILRATKLQSDKTCWQPASAF